MKDKETRNWTDYFSYKLNAFFEKLDFLFYLWKKEKIIQNFIFTLPTASGYYLDKNTK